MSRDNVKETINPENVPFPDTNDAQKTEDTTVDGYIIDNRYNAKYPILICQISAACFVLVAVLLLKFCFVPYYAVAREWYLENVAQNGTVNNTTQQERQNTKDLPSDISDGLSDDDGPPQNSENTGSYVETGALMLEVLNQKTTYANFGYPLKSYVITSGFGEREDPFSGEEAIHGGIDLAADSGSEIYASLDGKVETAQYSSDYGNYIVLSHGLVYKTLYGHCQKLLVENGQQVKKGQLIALVGTTGRSTGPHLHFEISVAGKKVNPLKYINL